MLKKDNRQQEKNNKDDINDCSVIEKSNVKISDNKFSMKQFNFQGDEQHLKNIINQLTQEQINSFEECQIILMGQQIKKQNAKCFFLTFIIGIICIIPLFLFCCNWWKQKVSQIFTINQKSYQTIGKLISGQRLKRVNIKFYDNYINKKKHMHIFKAINQNYIDQASIINMAGAFDVENNQYSNFKNHIQIYQLLNIKRLYISWFKQEYIQQSMNK